MYDVNFIIIRDEETVEAQTYTSICPSLMRKGQMVMIQLPGTEYLNMAEVSVYKSLRNPSCKSYGIGMSCYLIVYYHACAPQIINSDIRPRGDTRRPLTYGNVPLS